MDDCAVSAQSKIDRMMSKQPLLLIPVENQVRELDAKLLLACFAAQRGLPSIIGPKRELEARIGSFPPSIFLSKSLRIGKRKFFPISRLLGHDDFSRFPGPTWRHRVQGRLKATHRRLRQSYKSYLPGSPKSRQFQRHRYPVIPSEELGARLSRFRQILGDDGKLHLEQVSHKLFKISG